MSQFIEMFYNEKYPLQKLKTHIDVIRGVSYKPVDIKEETSDSISVILRSNNISNGQINFDDVVYVDNKRVTTEQVLSKGDIVMCGSNGSKKLVGKAAMINTIPSYRTSFGAFCLGIRCKESILPEYLSVYFQTPKYREVIEFLGSGSNILNIKPEHIYNLEIPIPSLEDQKHFVTIAEQADKSGFGGFKSQFIEMFKNEKMVPLGKFCSIEKGSTITRNEVSPGDIPVVAGGQEASCYHNVSNREAGMITVSASGAYAGFVNYWTCPIFASDCNTISPKEKNAIDTIFLFYGMKALQKHIYGLQKGGAQPHVYGKDLQNLLFPLPTIDKQSSFSRIAQQADKSGSVLLKLSSR